MVKPKSGLGRGLDSLINGSSSAPVNPPARQQTERVAVPAEEKKSVPAPPATKPAETPEKPKEEEIYINKEDNFTIKEVVEREVKQPQQEVKAAPEVKLNEVVPREVDEVDIDKVFPNPDQPRTNFKKEELEELSESIKKNGLLQPILVREAEEGTYQIIAGERRWQACQLIGMKKIPVRIKEATDEDTITLALVENIQRSDLNPIEEAYGYRRMMERGNMTQSEVAQAVSKGRSTIANALRLLELPEDAQQLLFEEKITAGHARAILSVPTSEGRKKLTEKLVGEQLSVRETEAIARLLSGKNNKKAEKKPPAPKSYKTVARTLQETLETNVKVKSSKGKNRIEIEFKDEADLERLFRIITAQ